MATSSPAFVTTSLQLVNSTSLPLVPGMGSNNYSTYQMYSWSFATTPQQSYSYDSPSFETNNESKDSAFQVFFYNNSPIFRVSASVTNKTTPLLTVQSPGNSLANTGLLVMACAPNHYC